MIRNIFGTEASSIEEQIKKCDKEFEETLFEKEKLVYKMKILKEKLNEEYNIFDAQYADKPSNPNDHNQQKNLKNIRKFKDKTDFIDYRIEVLDEELLRLEKEKKDLQVKENLSSLNI